MKVLHSAISVHVLRCSGANAQTVYKCSGVMYHYGDVHAMHTW